jgi:DNA (cytosine-5)-methyltransferase 1
VAWHPLGWRAAWVAEIEAFPSAVLAHHYPDVPNLGDMTNLPESIVMGHVEAPDVFCGGTPCQAFSVAGLRKSLDDARGNLSLTFCEIANAIDISRAHDNLEPCIVFWENVPGCLNTKDNAFGCILAGLAGEDDALVAPGGRWSDAGCVFGPQRAVAWRILDAQHFGLAQRRRRVFVVASAREGFDPAAVLFERESLRRNPAPRREARQVAPTIPARSTGGGGLGTDFDCDGGVIQAYGGNNQAGPIDVATARNACASASGRMDFESETFLVQPVAHSLRGEGFDASEDGTGRGTPLVPVHAFDARQSDVIQYGDMTGPLDTDGHTIGVMQPVAYALRADAARSGEAKNPSVDANGVSRLRDAGFNVEVERAPTLDCGTPHTVAFDTTQITSAANYSNPKPGDPYHPLAAGAHPPAIAISESGEIASKLRTGGNDHADSYNSVAVGTDCFNGGITGDVAATMGTRGSSQNASGPTVMQAMQVRRLTPVECERLQGFPDNYTAIPWRGKPADQCPDGPRYKALGNSWAVPCVRWIGWRIAAQVYGELA